MRVLFAASGGEGHLAPLLPFARAAVDAGDEVRFVVPPEQVATVAAAGLPYEPSAGVAGAALGAVRAAMAIADGAERARLAEVDLFGRLCTSAALPTIERTARDFRPDLIIREPCDYASAVIAARDAIPMVQVAISPGHADHAGLQLARDVVEPLADGVTALIEAAPYLTRFPDLDSGFADVRDYGAGGEAPARRATDRPVAWLTLGTVNSAFDAAGGTWAAALAAVAALPIDVIASTGRGAVHPVVPANVRVVDWVPLDEALATAAIVICHGGSGTTMAALGAGIPLVVVPMLADQPTNATMVEQLGAGIAVRPVRQRRIAGLTDADVPRLRQAILSVLFDPSYTEAAQLVAKRFAGRPSIAARMAELRR